MDAQLRADVQTSYDRLAEQYAKHIADELAGKPLDRQLLDRFASQVRGAGSACDLGCGPGHVARYLYDQGVDICGIDLSPAMVEQAHRLHPGLEFRQGDLFALEVPEGAWAGIVAFYSIVHIPRESMHRALGELRRVLRPGGTLLLSFHVGEEEVRPGELWGMPIPLTWFFFRPDEIIDYLTSAGFRVTEVIERAPYEGVEHPSRRAYLFAT